MESTAGGGRLMRGPGDPPLGGALNWDTLEPPIRRFGISQPAGNATTSQPAIAFPLPVTMAAEAAKRDAEGLIPKFQFERVLNQGREGSIPLSTCPTAPVRLGPRCRHSGLEIPSHMSIEGRIWTANETLQTTADAVSLSTVVSNPNRPFSSFRARPSPTPPSTYPHSRPTSAASPT